MITVALSNIALFDGSEEVHPSYILSKVSYVVKTFNILTTGQILYCCTALEVYKKSGLKWQVGTETRQQFLFF